MSLILGQETDSANDELGASTTSSEWVFIGSTGAPAFDQSTIYANNANECLRYKFIDANTILVAGLCRKDSKFAGATTLFTFPSEIVERINTVGISYAGAVTGGTGLNFTTVESNGKFVVHHGLSTTIVMANHTFILNEE